MEYIYLVGVVHMMVVGGCRWKGEKNETLTGRKDELLGAWDSDNALL